MIRHPASSVEPWCLRETERVGEQRPGQSGGLEHGCSSGSQLLYLVPAVRGLWRRVLGFGVCSQEYLLRQPERVPDRSGPHASLEIASLHFPSSARRD
jgi:hypothetical protein